MKISIAGSRRSSWHKFLGLENFILGILFVLPSLSWGEAEPKVKPSDFFCFVFPKNYNSGHPDQFPGGNPFQMASRITGVPSVVFQMHAKGCENAKGPDEMICAEEAMCAFVGPESKKGRNGKTFAKMDDEERLKFMEDKGVRALPSQLMCQGVLEPGGVRCPLPNDCAGDVLYNSGVGKISAGDIVKMEKEGVHRGFQPSGGETKEVVDDQAGKAD